MKTPAPPPNEFSSPAEPRAAQIVAVRTALSHEARSARAISVPEVDSLGATALEEPRKVAEAMLERAGALLGRVEALYGADDSEKITGLSFIGRMSLSQLSRHLVAIPVTESSAVELLDHVASIAANVGELCSALHQAIGEVERLPLPGSFQPSELQQSLKLRRAFRDLYEAAYAGGELSGENVRVRLSRIHTSLGKFASNPSFDSLRAEERRAFRKLHARTDAVLNDIDAMDLAGALKLWHDVSALLSIFMAINNRQVLVRHDAAVLEALLVKAPNAADVQQALHADLVTMLGRDRHLDAFALGDLPNADPSEVLASVRRVLLALQSEISRMLA